MKLEQMSCEELADMARRGRMTELAMQQEKLIEVLELKSKLIEREFEIRRRMEEI